MKFKLILTTCFSFFLLAGSISAQEEKNTTPQEPKIYEIELFDGSKITAEVIKLDIDYLELKIVDRTVIIPMDKVKSTKNISKRPKVLAKTSDVKKQERALHYYAKNGFPAKTVLFKSNLLMQNSLSFKTSTNTSLELNVNVFPKGIEFCGLTRITYSNSKLFHPYLVLGVSSRFGFLDNNFIDLRHGISIGNNANFINLEAGINYSLNTSSLRGLNYEVGVFSQVGKNTYLFLEHKKSALGLIKYHNVAGVQFKLFRLNGQVGLQNIFTNNNLLDIGEARGSLFGPMVRLIKPLKS
jgi:hypothetical protein